MLKWVNINMNWKILLSLIVLLFSPVLIAQEHTGKSDYQSKIGMEWYNKLTKNPILSQIMMNAEPKLVKYYKGRWYSDQDIIDSLSWDALAIWRDKLNKRKTRVFTKASPESLLAFLDLSEKEYPVLHARWKNQQLAEWNQQLKIDIRQLQIDIRQLQIDIRQLQEEQKLARKIAWE